MPRKKKRSNERPKEEMSERKKLCKFVEKKGTWSLDMKLGMLANPRQGLYCKNPFCKGSRRLLYKYNCIRCNHPLRTCTCSPNEVQTAIVIRSSNSFCGYCWHERNERSGVSGKDSSEWLRTKDIFSKYNLERLENELLWLENQYKEADKVFWDKEGHKFVKTDDYAWGSTNRHLNVRNGLVELIQAVRNEQQKQKQLANLSTLKYLLRFYRKTRPTEEGYAVLENLLQEEAHSPR